jgi:hypothetical protein
VPLSATEVEVPTGYFTQPRYIISFKDNGGTLSDFEVKFNADDLKYMADNGVVVTDGPNILIADPVAKRFKFQFVVSTGTANRYLIDEFYK